MHAAHVPVAVDRDVDARLMGETSLPSNPEP
jgi:hypothetical protein